MLSDVFDRDARSVRRVLAGQGDQFEPLVRRYLPAVRAVALAHTRNAADADDVAQEAFIAAYRSLDRLREPAQFRAWLMTIARNTAQSFLRGRQRENAARERIEMDETVTSPDWASEELRDALREQLDALDADTRELLLLHYFSGYNAREIGAMLNLSHGAVRKRLQRGREALGARLLAALGESPKRRSDERTVKAITAAAIGAGAAWRSTGAAGSAPALMNAKLLGAAAVLAGCAGVAGLALLWPAPGAPNRDVSPVTETAVVASAKPGEAQAAPIAAPAPPEYAGSSAEAADTVPARRIPEAEAVVDAAGLSGLWELYLGNVGEAAQPELIVEIVDEGGALRMFSRSRESPLGLYRGTESEGAVRLASYPGPDWRPISNAAPDPAMAEAYLRDFADASPNRRERVAEFVGRILYDAGGLKASVDTLRFDADARVRETANLALAIGQHLRSGEHFSSLEGTVGPDARRIDGTLILQDPEAEQRITVALLRMDASEAEALASVAAIEDELSAFEKALEAYIARHDGRLPESLEALLTLAPDLESSWKHLNRRAISLHRIETAMERGEARFDDAFAPELPQADRYLAWEEYLKDAWGPMWPQGAAVATVRLPDIGRTARLTVRFGRVDWRFDEPAAADNEPRPEEQEAALLASCQNNMKQLGIVIKMYAGENPHRMVPPGWRTAYPEYMTDPNVLICPCTPDSNEPYTLLFPAFAEPILEDLAEQLLGERSQSRIPVVVENETNHRGGAGRNVLFLDGHVEFLTPEGYAQSVAPFLPYSVSMP